MGPHESFEVRRIVSFLKFVAPLYIRQLKTLFHFQSIIASAAYSAEVFETRRGTCSLSGRHSASECVFHMSNWEQSRYHQIAEGRYHFFHWWTDQIKAGLSPSSCRKIINTEVNNGQNVCRNDRLKDMFCRVDWDDVDSRWPLGLRGTIMHCQSNALPKLEIVGLVCDPEGSGWII